MGILKLLIFLGAIATFCYGFDNIRPKHTEDIIATDALFYDVRLPKSVIPTHYALALTPNLEDGTYSGNIKISLSWNEDTNNVTLHAHPNLNIDESSIKLSKYNKINNRRNRQKTEFQEIEIQGVVREPRNDILIIFLKAAVNEGHNCKLEIPFTGQTSEGPEGLFKGSYENINGKTKNYWATNLRPNKARVLFPCFDEPSFKVSYTVSIYRPKVYTTLFNTDVDSTETLNDTTDVDHFQTTKPMPSFSFGFIISQLPLAINGTPSETKGEKPSLRIWGRKEIHGELREVYNKFMIVYDHLEKFFDVQLPLRKIDLVVVPSLASNQPANNWGLLVFKESDLLKKSYYGLVQELIFQWFGSWVTPNWWNDNQVYQALAHFLAHHIIFEINNGVGSNGDYPSTDIYALYYSYGQRYPRHRTSKELKALVTCSKTEFVIRMLNYTLGRDTFKNAIRRLIADKHYGTLTSNDLWNALTKQAHEDQTLCKDFTINEIVRPWIVYDRLPVVSVDRSCQQKTAKVTQKVYLRERPHDLPESDKMLWWIPLVIVAEDYLDFKNTTPRCWVKKSKELNIKDQLDKDQFIIVNPEQIGPFLVNYDKKNWDLLAEYLQAEDARKNVPVHTRAKLLHDAWNLAYAGDLDFATAFNMTLFLKYERNNVVWKPFFQFVDHVGRHIDIIPVYVKFMKYVIVLLKPLYEEIGQEQDHEEYWKSDMRPSVRSIFCSAGYRPCITQAQNKFKKWIESENLDAEDPYSISRVFQWGTLEEYEAGLQRVINFRPSGHQIVRSTRSWLHKLIGVSKQPEKIELLLNVTILEEKGNFTEDDFYYMFFIMTSGSSGYATLFNFLSNNWDTMKKRFGNNTRLWNRIITTATGKFNTQEGYDLISKLYLEKQTEFNSAEKIIEESLRGAKEEAEWSKKNLPIMENWLDDYLIAMNTSEVDENFMLFS